MLAEPKYVDAARDAANLIVGAHLEADGRLRRASRNGVAGSSDGVLEDYAAVAEGLFALFGATGERRWYDVGSGLVDQIQHRFDDGNGAFYDTATDAEQLIKRPQDPTDNASPSGQSLALGALVTRAALTGRADDAAAAENLLASLAGLADAAPRFAGHLLTVAEAMADGPRQVAVVGADGDGDRGALVRAAYRLTHPGVVVAQGTPGTTVPPLLADRGLVEGRAAAYVCRGFVCDLPVTSPDLVQ